ncbi:MAG: methylmalonyl-CoA mutase family protein [Gemmatimonadales bacterium]
MTTVMSDTGLLERLAAQEAELARLRAEVAAWKATVAKLPVRDDATFETLSGVAVEPVYTPLDAGAGEPLPGEYPYTRGIHPTMYRGRLWTMRQFAGFGTAEDTNQPLPLPSRPRPDRPLGRLRLPDADGVRLRPSPCPRARSGSAAWRSSSLADMETLFDGIPLDQVSVSMTINGAGGDPARCFYRRRGREAGRADREAAAARSRTTSSRSSWRSRRGSTRPQPSLKLIVDLFEWTSAAHAAVELDLDLGLPHPRGRVDGGAGAGLHAAPTASTYVERGLGARPRRRRVRAAALVLLGRAQRLLRGDREVARGAPHLGAASCASATARRTERSLKLRFHCADGGLSR